MAIYYVLSFRYVINHVKMMLYVINSQETHVLTIQMYVGKSLWIKASAKCINVNVNK